MSFRKTFFQRQLDDDSSSDDDDYVMMSSALLMNPFSNVERKQGGSVPGHAGIYRDRESGHNRMFQDYLADNPTYGPQIFRRSEDRQQSRC
ncbi:hypothetical protein PVAP13_9NG085773 [Panicum virgatum]|uniref:Uncharacterized protein n=1 Tax=Panicum virgatum TaxID=38727 RepID=A0A8T0MCX7_PANVG|nr:hypothetical protein PVAP13_9NG085773 [Panicum virgatum]